MARSTLKSIKRLIDSAQENVPVEQQFLGDLKSSIEMSSVKDARLPSKTYKPSSMNCIRSMWYQVMGTNVEIEPATYTSVGITGSGSDIHVRIQKSIEQMRENGFDCEYIDVADFVKMRNLDNLTVVEKSGMETKLYNKDLNLSFMTDGILRYKNKYYILELKTETGFKFNNRREVDKKHYNQGICYSISFNIPDIIFVYISRDILDMKAFLFTPDDDMKNNVIGMITTCDDYVRTRTLPPKPDNIERLSCTYCMYKSLCEANKSE